ncbi:MAG: amidohydrolase family protein [Gemmatimonadota bacterium]
MLTLLMFATMTHLVQPTTVAYVNYNVVPMDSNRVLTRHTVVVRGGRIMTLGAVGQVTIPAGAQVVDGRGVDYLTPALADMHTHSIDANELKTFVANGVTTILNLAHSPADFVTRERHLYGSGERLGPQVFEALRVNWPYGGAPGVATKGEARAAVTIAQQQGYDFIKVYSFLTDSVHEELFAASRQAGMTVVGHQTYDIGLYTAFRRGQRMVAHAEEFLPIIGDAGDTSAMKTVIDSVKHYGVWVTPGLSTYEAIAAIWGKPIQLVMYTQAADARLLSASTMAMWQGNRLTRQNGSVNNRYAAFVELTRRMHAAGVPLLLGTDAPGVPGMFPGLSVFEELRLLQSAGLSPFEALATSTRNAGNFMTRFAPGVVPFGTITVGARADFIITERSPLKDLTALRYPKAIVRLGVARTPAAIVAQATTSQ